MANNTNLSFPSAFCQQFFKDGKPLSSGKLYTYIAGSSTSVVTYKTISGGTESANMNTNPIILDMSGKANLVISKDTAYKFVLFDRNDVKVDEWDNVTAGGSEGGGSSTPVVVDGTANEITVTENEVSGVKHFIVSLAETVKDALSSLANAVSDINGKIPSGASSSNKLVTENELEEKQDSLTFDSAPTENSDNPVTSGGVFAAIKNVDDKIIPPLISTAEVVDYIRTKFKNITSEVTFNSNYNTESFKVYDDENGTIYLVGVLRSTTLNSPSNPIMTFPNKYKLMSNGEAAVYVIQSQNPYPNWGFDISLGGYFHKMNDTQLSFAAYLHNNQQTYKYGAQTLGGYAYVKYELV